MSSTPTPDLPLSRLLSRPVLISGLAVLLAALLAWAWLLTPSTDMADMSTADGMASIPPAVAPWSADYLTTTFVMWLLMMVAMMLPAAAPMILLRARIDRGTDAQRTRETIVFVASYLLVWASFSALATLGQAFLVDSKLVDTVTLTVANKNLAAGLLIAAALWQLTSAKATCLERCQSPIQFVMRYWSPGAAGAARLGLVHGLFCLGCCWSLMLLLFAGGVMNLAIVAALAAVVFAEKLAPPAWHVERWLAGLLMLCAGAVLWMR